MSIIVERDTDGRFVASDDVSVVYGVGESSAAAVEDYKIALSEFFEIANEADR